MKTKVTGAQFLEFWNDPAIWGTGQDFYLESSYYTINDIMVDGDDLEVETELKPDDLITSVDGCIAWQGSGPEPRFDGDLGRVFKKWLKNRDTTTFLVNVRADKADELKALLKQMGAMLP